MTSETQERAASLLRLAKHHGKEAGRWALSASVALNDERMLEAEVWAFRSQVETKLANHYNSEAARIIGEYGL
jgi:hypothetical protein